MIYELRTYTLQPGKQPEYLKLNADVGRKIRGDKYGKFEGGWTTEFGPLNRYVHLWSYQDLAERNLLRQELAKNKDWTTQYTPKVGELVIAQENKILAPIAGVPFKAPTDGGKHVYELRWYRTRLGRVAEWASLFAAALPHREKYSPLVCLWQTDLGQLNEVVHLWAYRDLNHRSEARAGSQQDPGWTEFTSKGRSLLVEQQSILLLPSETSPLK